MIDERDLFQFYDERLPEHVIDRVSLQQWYKTSDEKQKQALLLSKEILTKSGTDQAHEALFPDHLVVNGIALELSYHFEPGHANDGVTVSVPTLVLQQIPVEPFEWLVPGMLRDKIIALIKSLPKAIRKSFVPVPNYADACVNALQDKSVSLLKALSTQLQKIGGFPLPDDVWRELKLDNHYLMNFRIVDDQGETLACGRHLDQLQAQFEHHAQQQLSQLDNRHYEKTNLTRWDFGDLPHYIEVRQAGLAFKAYPALIDEGESVALRLLDNLPAAVTQSKAGIRRLFMLESRQNIKYLAKNLPHIEKMCLYYASIDTCEHLKEELIIASVDEALFGDGGLSEDLPDGENSLIRSRIEFEQHCERARQRLVPNANRYSETVFDCLQVYHNVVRSLKQHTALNQLNAISDIKEQLALLIYPKFVVNTPRQWLGHLPRYLKGVEVRLQKLQHSLAADQQRQSQLQPYWRKLIRQVEADAEAVARNPQWQLYRWMLEEMRISLFAQNLKTSMPVSTKRLDEQLAKLK